MDPSLIQHIDTVKHIDRAIGFALIGALGIGISWLWRATWRHVYSANPKLKSWGFRTHTIEENIDRLYDQHLAAKAETEATRNILAECDRLNGRPPKLPNQ